MAELNNFQFAPWMIGLLYGLAAAILCGFGWAVLVKVIHAEGIVAVAVGYIVARAIFAGSNGRRGRPIQVLAMVLSVAGVFIGKGLTVVWAFWPEFCQKQGLSIDDTNMRVLWFFRAPAAGFHMMDLLWYALAAYQAWRMAKPLQLNIQGPFGVEAGYANPSIVGGAANPSSESMLPPMLQDTGPAPAPRSTPLPKAILITLISAAISIAFYSHEDGWVFATGFVLCILVHELGHTIACLFYGLPASSPIFIPYVGALISLRAQPPDAKVESVIGIAGPVGGLLAATVCYIWYRTTHSQLAAGLVWFGTFMNLFNLLPLHPLDGGRIARGIAPGFWAIFAIAAAAFCALAPRIGISMQVAVLAAVITAAGVARTLMSRRGPYYDISAAAAWSMGFAYLGVAATLIWMWSQVRGSNMF